MSFLIFCAAFFAACSTPTVKTSGQQDQTISQHAIARGMSAGEVRARIGEPNQIRLLDKTPGAEVWVYLRKIGSNTSLSATGSHGVPFVNPATGAASTMQELDYSTERKEVDQRTELLIFNGKLIEWKRYATEAEGSSYN